jgi:hypothetical protein
MIRSTRQRAASRANSQKSTGPRTAEGKAVSKFNALKHAIFAVHQIMFDEKPEDLAELADEYHELYSPADSKQRFLVDTLVHNEWRLRRMRRVEAELWYRAYNACLVRNIETSLTCTSGDAFATDSSTFERLQRVVNSCERIYHRTLRELDAARAHGLRTPQTDPEAAPASPQAPQAEQSKPTSTSSASFRQNPKTPPPATPKPPDGTHAAPSAQPDPGANPAETQPSTVDGDPKPPEAA